MTRVLIVGTGTIGQPLAKAALELKSQLGIDEIIILKNTPRIEDVGMVRRFQSCGAKICAYEEKFSQFVQFGMTPDYDFENEGGFLFLSAPYAKVPWFYRPRRRQGIRNPFRLQYQ